MRVGDRGRRSRRAALVVALVLGLTACGDAYDDDDSPGTSPNGPGSSAPGATAPASDSGGYDY